MNKKKFNMIISIVLIAIIIIISAIIISSNNNKTTKQTTSVDNISKEESTDNSYNDPEEEPELEESPESEEPLLPEETPTADTTAIPEKTASPEINNASKNNTAKYYIKVNNQMNTVTVYTKDENGEYTKPVKAMICSTGSVTPRNHVYKIQRKYPGWRKLFGHGPYKYVYGQYSQWITGDILFHSVPYITTSKDSLEWYEYNKLGTTCSQGCIRLICSDAKWLYDNCAVGTTVEFYDSPNPGPLGKPSFQYISEDSPNKGWDPTDPDPANPWRKTSTQTPSVSQTPIAEKTPISSPSTLPTVTPTTTSSNTTSTPETTKSSPTASISVSKTTPPIQTTSSTVPIIEKASE